jgi:hypothetical protein
MRRPLRFTVRLGLLVGLLAGGQVATAAAADGRHSYSGTIDGAQFRVEVPEQWNGTLVLYRASGLDLRADLDRLAAAPRIAPDPAAVGFLTRYGVPRGRTPVPVVTLHSVGDGGAVPDQERWYADQVRRAGDSRELRQLYVDRGMHCSFNAADEIVAMRTLFERIDSGRWPDTSPRTLNEEARELGDGYGPRAGLRHVPGRRHAAGIHHVHAA